MGQPPGEWLLVLTLEAVVFYALGLALGTLDAHSLSGAWVPLLSPCGVMGLGCTALALLAVVFELARDALPWAPAVLAVAEVLDTVGRRTATLVTAHAVLAWLVMLVQGGEFAAGFWLQGAIPVEQRTWLLHLHAVGTLVLYVLGAACLLAARRGTKPYPQLPAGTQVSSLLLLLLASEYIGGNMAARARTAAGVGVAPTLAQLRSEQVVSVRVDEYLLANALLLLGGVAIANGLSMLAARGVGEATTFLFLRMWQLPAGVVLGVALGLAAVGPVVLLALTLAWLLPLAGTAAAVACLCVLAAVLVFERAARLLEAYKRGRGAADATPAAPIGGLGIEFRLQEFAQGNQIYYKKSA